MEFETYYGMDYNPFTKGIDSTRLYQSNDYRQMASRLQFLIRTKGIGLFLGEPGTGKTASLRSVLDGLNESRYRVVYIRLTTVTPIDFYHALNDALGLEESSRKSVMFAQIQHEMERMASDHVNVILAIDECQYLTVQVLKEFVMLMNFAYDSVDCCTLILMGQPEALRTLRAKSLEPFKQRINMNYFLTGMDEEEVRGYVLDRLRLVHCSTDLFDDECYHTLHSLMRGSARLLNNLICKSLQIGMIREQRHITTEIVMAANEEVSAVYG